MLPGEDHGDDFGRVSEPDAIICLAIEGGPAGSEFSFSQGTKADDFIERYRMRFLSRTMENGLLRAFVYVVDIASVLLFIREESTYAGGDVLAYSSLCQAF